ncbi:MAG TPA: DEAD/DEAH box helicase [Chthoniobacteraceae bacterium]|jgi:non-specific serine/threonine protein kinase|nr:DEAD/DEAH box helicase [Chthoniobacteraceae bacterium]
MNTNPGALYCTPEPRLAAGESAPAALAEAFAKGEAAGLLHLATIALKDELAPPLAWAREWGRRFVARLCQTRNPATVELPEPDARAAFLAEAPPLRGAEYLSDALLARLWEELRATVAAEAAAHADGLAGWLRERNPLWHLVGRVTFHLAENKRNEQVPFAFLATYTDRLSASGQLQHTPLGRALQEYAGKKDQAALDSLLQPVRLAAEKSTLVRGLLETKRLFQALAWSPSEAYQLVREIPLLEESGLVIKLPDWWKGRRPARPQVSVTLDAPALEKVGIDAMLSFNANVTLEGEALTAEEWRRIKATPSGLVNLRGQWIEVDREQLDQVLDHWTKVQDAHRQGGLSFHEGMRWLAGYPAATSDTPALELDAGREWSQVVAGSNLEKLLAQMREPADVEKIPGLRATLRPYQKRGAGWLHFTSRLGLGGCLADDMGLGKTLQVIALLCLRHAEKKGAAATSIVIMPASLIGNWLGEFARFAPHLRVVAAHPSACSRETLAALAVDPVATLRECDVLLTTYGLLQRSESLHEQPWDLAILDEAQAIKNPATAQARSVKKLNACARVALTGTPVENKLGDLWSLFDFLNPGLLGKAPDFARVTKQLGAPGHPQGYAPLRRLIRPYLLRRLKTDRSIISDLPDKTEVTVHCPLTKKQAMLYGKIVEQLKADLANEELDENTRRGLVLGYLVRFKQVCNHPSHWSGDGRYAAEESGKFARLTDIVTELAERQERCLVFTQFREMTEPLAAHLASIFGRPGLVLHGGTPVKQRPRMVEDFQRPDGPPFFVLSVKAGGTGLTLTAASHVIHFDRWWNPAVENQATDRAFRIGQKRNVLVHKFVCPGTIEEKVDALMAGKRALAEELLAADAGAEKLLTEMNNDELLNFVRLDINAAAL